MMNNFTKTTNFNNLAFMLRSTDIQKVEQYSIRLTKPINMALT